MKRETESAVEVIADNVFENSSSISNKLEIRLGIMDSALSLINVGEKINESDAELAQLYKSRLSQPALLSCESATPRKSRRHIKAYASAMSVADSVAFSRMLLERAEHDSESGMAGLLESQLRDSLPEDIRIVYRKARGADIAFEKFSSLIPDCAALYRDTFLEVCDALALGEADMCILPYENTEDGKLNGFYRLIDSYEMKIAASCSVKSQGREDITRYLLLSKSLGGISAVSGVTDFEFLLCDRADMSLTKALTAAHLLSLDVRSIDTVVTEENLTVFDIRVHAKAKALDEYILYLKLDELDFTPLGIFAQID